MVIGAILLPCLLAASHCAALASLEVIEILLPLPLSAGVKGVYHHSQFNLFLTIAGFIKAIYDNLNNELKVDLKMVSLRLGPHDIGENRTRLGLELFIFSALVNPTGERVLQDTQDQWANDSRNAQPSRFFRQIAQHCPLVVDRNKPSNIIQFSVNKEQGFVVVVVFPLSIQMFLRSLVR